MGAIESIKTSIVTSVKCYMKYAWAVCSFIFETIGSVVPIILIICAWWTWYARKYEMNYMNKDDIVIMHTAITGVLTFLLAMRLNNAMAANKQGFESYCSACAYLEMFQQRVVLSKPSERTIMDLIVFLPLVIKHELRGDYNVKMMDISHYNIGDSDAWASYDGPVSLSDALRSPYRTRRFDNDDDGSDSAEVDDLLYGIQNFDSEFSQRERIETMILHRLKEEGLWVDTVLRNWTQYRTASSSIGGALSYSPPISFSFIVWLTLAMYIFSMPYMIPVSSSLTSATATATVSAACLVLLHINANSVANPFKSSNTFQTVTHAAHACTRNLLTTVVLFRKNGSARKSSSLNL